MNRYLFMIDRISAWSGKLFAWSVVLLTLLVCFDVTMRYILNKPNQWVFDVAYILYGVSVSYTHLTLPTTPYV